jgi:hypothetical protein
MLYTKCYTSSISKLIYATLVIKYIKKLKEMTKNKNKKANSFPDFHLQNGR